MKNVIKLLGAMGIIVLAYLVGIVGLVMSAIISVPLLFLAIQELRSIYKNKKGKPGPLGRTMTIVVIYIITMYIFSPYMKDIYGVAFLFITALLMVTILFPIIMFFNKKNVNTTTVTE